ncbi:hypothetical protein SD377_003444 [Cronobacter turicensis]|nr:hypothetical protein [Cronobacter turicensis]ELY4216299.1 hypothetical protein [Cronobacter turicensis]EMA1793149.1 hypothetical protein [Cronobacter turicensis]EMA1802113.1 hypothetical protein [Cronobacter turicensis]EMA1850800.1 hypothetical protein [Cronobacter turicensis]
MNQSNISAPSKTGAKPFNNAGYADTQPQKMTSDECFARFHQKLKATQNGALRNFNKLEGNFKFVVMTLANRMEPGTFKSDEIGQPFEYFDQPRRLLLIKAMNEITRWGEILPRRFSHHESYLPD